jgi:hypothetical protein
MLSHDEILELQAAVVSAELGLRRNGLLTGVNSGFVATLEKAGASGEQTLTDLGAINAAGALGDGTVPLVVWLKNAVRLAGGRTEAEIFKRTLARVTGSTAALEPAHSTSLPGSSDLLSSKLAVETEPRDAALESAHSTSLPGSSDLLSSQLVVEAQTRDAAEGTMSASEVRAWLGTYVLVLTSLVGGYLYMAPAWMLPLEDSDRTASIQIIVPFLLAQLTVVFRYYADAAHEVNPRRIAIPTFFVKGPPILLSTLLVVEFTLMAVGGVTGKNVPDPGNFKGFLTFAVGLLNASSVFVITKYFETRSPARDNALATNTEH